MEGAPRMCLPLLVLLAGCPYTSGTVEDSAENLAPRLTVDAPRSGAAFTEGDEIVVTGLVSDDTDAPDALSLAVLADDAQAAAGSAVEDGTFSIPVVLAAGDHVLAITATDSAGAASTATFPITVAAATDSGGQ